MVSEPEVNRCGQFGPVATLYHYRIRGGTFLVRRILGLWRLSYGVPAVMTSRRSWYDVVLRLCEGLDVGGGGGSGIHYSLKI